MAIEQNDIDSLLNQGKTSEEAGKSPAGSKTETVFMSLDDKKPAHSAITNADPAEARGDVSAITIARMMGLATLGEVKLVESKLDLLSTKLSTVLVKLERVMTVLAGVPSGADIERVDVQIGALRQLIRESLVDQATKKEGSGLETGKKPGSNIQTNSGTPEQAEPKA